MICKFDPTGRLVDRIHDRFRALHPTGMVKARVQRALEAACRESDPDVQLRVPLGSGRAEVWWDLQHTVTDVLEGALEANHVDRTPR
ncbi:hypothetical protein [Paludisphaera mucosa]|uniref:Uncharacterized protein n=1 Tax=Paludisphaera mucosa TaxID=3030827 RepID=A0ABT6F5T4_9BACT|nr:hypothetical protein [Paludisphaera mucosa]MDG3002861.1 hypothetical protein [Paludisphaera mucosa]